MDPAQTLVSAPPPASKVPRRLGLGGVIALCFLGAFALGVLGVAVAAHRTFGLGTDARALREAARESFAPADDWTRKIEICVGPMACGIIRAVASSHVREPEAMIALRGIRAVQVGVYEVAGDAEMDRARFLRTATASMQARGWTRVVAVLDGSSMVAVFVPSQLPAGEAIEVGVLVRDGENVVVATVRANLVPLLEIIRRHGGAHQIRSFVVER